MPRPRYSVSVTWYLSPSLRRVFGIGIVLQCPLPNRQHAFEGDAGVLRGVLVHLHLIDDAAGGEFVEGPCEVCRVDAVHGGAGADDRVEAQDELGGVLAAEARDAVER